MKIIEITDKQITFDNECYLTYGHEMDCCEHNYADFTQLEDTGIEDEEFEFNENMFELCEHGFRLVAKNNNKYFIPCYSVQNGWYNTELDIYLNCKKIQFKFNLNCKLECS